MTPDILAYIRHLTSQDRKTLSQKALKTSEEVGELAKVVLPYDGAYATNHRFVAKERILEECVDTILCTLSIAYELEFSDQDVTDMMQLKAEKWASLQVKECDVKYPLPYEIHVTVEIASNYIEDFRLDCAAIRVKPIILDLQGKDGQVAMVDVMTSSTHFGDNRSAYEEARRVEADLKGLNYHVVRVKIETVPWHPAAPTLNQQMPPNCYFESHIPMIFSSPDELQHLRKSVTAKELHISRNVFKKTEDGSIVVMATYRKYDGNSSDFKAEVDAHVEALRSRNVQLGPKIHTEFAVYDTKVSHDAKWLTA